MWKLKNCLVKPVITNTANIIIMFLLFYKKDVKYVTYINLLDLLLFACMCPVMSDGLFLTPRPSLPGSSVHGISQARIWSGLPFPSPGDLPNPGIKPMSLVSPALVGGFFTTSLPWEAHHAILSGKILYYQLTLLQHHI